jgi:hypothetical protein
MKIHIISILFILLFSGLSWSAVLYDNNASATMNHDIYLPIAYSTPANSNRLMLVSVVWMTSGTLSGSRCNVCAESGVFSGCSYGGYNLLNLKTTTNNEVLYLYNPPTSGTLECYWEDICHVDAVVGVTTFSGVDQTVGLGNPVDASGSSSPITTALIGVSANNLFWDSVAVARGSAPTMTITPVVGQNPNWNKKAGADKCSTYPLGASSWKQGIAGATSLNWTESTNKAWWTVGVEVKASTAAGNTAPNSSLVYLLNGTAGTTLGTPYKNNPIYYNASGNCSDLENSTLTGVFNFYLNGSFWQNFTTYNWNANKTNYTNTSVTGLNKSDSLFVGLLCYDGGTGGKWSNQTNSTTYTINNTAPVVGAPSVNNSAPIKTSVLLCTNGSYSDADSDTIGTGRWRWFLNNTVIGGQTAQALDLAAIGANKSDRLNCSYKTEDSGYDVKNSTEMYSINATVNNTAPSVTVPTINNTIPYFDDIIFCNNGTYSDNDNDLIGLGRWRWWLNDVELGGQTTQTLNLSAVGANATQWINCSYKTEDSGYQTKNSTEQFSIGIGIIAYPPPPAGGGGSGTGGSSPPGNLTCSDGTGIFFCSNSTFGNYCKQGGILELNELLCPIAPIIKYEGLPVWHNWGFILIFLFFIFFIWKRDEDDEKPNP